MKTVWALASRLLAALYFILCAGAVVACTLPSLRTNERPPGADPTEVIAAFYVLDFLGVDDVNQQIEVDIEGHFSWTDARLSELEGCRFGVSEVWSPRLTLANSSNLRAARTNALNQISVGPDGMVRYRQRFTGSISSYHNLRQFPFDSHRFSITLVGLGIPTDELTLVADAERTLISPRLNIEGWHVEGVEIESETRFFPQLDENSSVLELTIIASRDSVYYVTRVLLLMLFVTAMSWTVFWVHPSKMEFQMGLGATSMLTIIAFNVAIASSLPRLGYLTILDKMVIWSIFLVFMSIVEGLAAGLMVSNGREEDALRLDKASRWVFPLAMIIGWLAIAATA